MDALLYCDCCGEAAEAMAKGGYDTDPINVCPACTELPALDTDEDDTITATGAHMQRFPMTRTDAMFMLDLDEDDLANGSADLGNLDKETSAGEWADLCAAAEVLGGSLEIDADGVTFTINAQEV